MKEEDLQRTIKETVLDVFVNMYFMFPEPIGEHEAVSWFPESCFRARVCLENRPEGLFLYGSEQLVAEMAENLLGPDRTIGEADLIDVFKEAANVLAGNLVSRLALGRDVAIGIPVAERWHPRSQTDTAPGSRGIMFHIDDEVLKVVFTASDE
ncbi:MAG: chemotaxis protein CheX [Desulfobacterales bacterium]|nr:chemotaxis protein CheX [Desulfobacterales bacterium]